MSEGNQSQISWIAQTALGTLETGSNYKKLRVTGHSLKANRSKVRSADINTNGVVGKSRQVGKSAGGDINFELALEEYEDFIRAGIRSGTFSAEVELADQTTFSVSGSTLSDSNNGLGSLVVGRWIHLTSSDTSKNHNVVAKIKTVAAGAIELESPSKALVSESGTTMTLKQGARIVNGTTQTGFTIEEKVLDVANTFFLFDYAVPSSVNLDLTTDDDGGAIVTGSVGFNAANGTTATSSPGNGYDAESTNPKIDTGSDEITILENGTDFGTSTMSINIATTVGNRRKIGIITPYDLSKGILSAGGSLTRHFANKTAYDKFLDHTDTSIAIVIKDTSATAKWMIIEFPRVHFFDADPFPDGESDRMLNVNWEAEEHSTEGILVRITKF